MSPWILILPVCHVIRGGCPRRLHVCAGRDLKTCVSPVILHLTPTHTVVHITHSHAPTHPPRPKSGGLLSQNNRATESQTFVSDILIAVNPFKTLSIYTEDVARQFSNCQPGSVKPHVSPSARYHTEIRCLDFALYPLSRPHVVLTAASPRPLVRTLTPRHHARPNAHRCGPWLMRASTTCSR